MNFKHILIVVILIAIIGGGVLVRQQYWQPKKESGMPEMATQTRNEVTNWKTYQNKEYNFAIDYPKSWYAYSVQIGDLEYDQIATFPKAKYEQYYGTENYKELGNWGVVHIGYTKNNDLEKYVESIDRLIKALGRGPVSKIETSNIEEINLQGMKGYKISFSGKGYIRDENFTNIFYLILHKNGEGILRFEGIFAGDNKEEYEKYAEIFINQIFPTFRFLE